jgi:hypothetical protein
MKNHNPIIRSQLQGKKVIQSLLYVEYLVIQWNIIMKNKPVWTFSFHVLFNSSSVSQGDSLSTLTRFLNGNSAQNDLPRIPTPQQQQSQSKVNQYNSINEFNFLLII